MFMVKWPPEWVNPGKNRQPAREDQAMWIGTTRTIFIWIRRPIVASTFTFIFILILAGIVSIAKNGLEHLGLSATPLLEAIQGPVDFALGVAIAVFLALMHNEHLREFKELETRIQLNSRIEERIKRFLPGYQVYENRYDVIIPTEQLKRPMAFVAPGDLFVLHVLESAMEMVAGAPKTSRTLTLCHVEKKQNYWDARIQADLRKLYATNCIFLCNPLANPAAYALMPSVLVDNSGNPVGKEAKANVERIHQHPNECRSPDDPLSRLPVWFGYVLEPLGPREKLHEITMDEAESCNTTLGSQAWHQKGIIFLQQPEFDYSHSAERAYSKAAAGITHVTAPLPDVGVQSGSCGDYGIIARFTTRPTGHKQRKEIYIAGVHQYGTWIAGEFIKRILYGDENDVYKDARKYFLGDDDFIALVYGRFNIAKLTVDHVGISEDRIWRLLDGQWLPVKASDSDPL
jgi:hypothetical protein